GFPDGTGTKVPSTNISGGNFTVDLTGLAPNTKYYFKAYATNAGGTGYGGQLTFTNPTLPVPMAAQPGLSYTETFSDIANWNNLFINGIGANHFNALGATGAGGIPNGTTITASTLSFVTGSTGGVQRGSDQSPATQTIVFLSTGTADNSTSTAIDFYMDFTGVNAGTLSFDWASVNNSTGDRKGSLRVYSSIDGISFTEMPFAAVLNFTNNSLTSGNKSNIALPASFNNNPNARLRFYYSNGTGGTTGSRPKISIDNLNVTAVASTPCTTPTAPATGLVFGTITDVSIQGSFTASSPATDNYMVVMSTSSSLTGNPIDGQIYSIGDNVGDGSVIAKGSGTSFTATGLTALTTYYFFIFPVNAICTGGPLYYTTTVLNGSATTIAGLPPCAAPASQATNLVFGSTTSNSIQGSFTATTADQYLVLRSTSPTLSNNPADGQVYNSGDALGNAIVVQRNATTSFNATGLLPNTQYYFFIFSLNNQGCVSGPAYNTVTPLNASQTTLPLPPCATPSAQPTSLILTASNTSISGTFTGVPDADNYLVVRNTSPTLSSAPVDNTDYNAGDNIGGGIVVTNTSSPNFLAINLTPNTTYYFFVYASNKNCAGGTKYLSINPLIANATTINAPVNNYYFGTLHSHSDYSDGNKDNPGYTPTQDYAYAQTAQCMDYLGISEHNHFSSPDNPGNTITTYHLGTAEANAYTSSNPGFLALYGMEWGVISGGGHVVVYGDGMDDLYGWESGAGGWGSSNNYDVYVPKSVYTGPTGLFKIINDNVAKNTFATLAHPNLGDFNGIGNGTPYDVVADAAIVGTTVESGPATSTNTTYTNPGSSMGYLWYYQTMLAKGYHLGPTIDHDNHNTTFGKTTYSRTAIIAPVLTKTEIVKAMRNMHFYATQDCDTKVDFNINTRIMGSSFVDRYAPIISVSLTDATTPTTNAIIRVMFGVPGSGSMAVKVDSIIGNSLTFTDVNLGNGATGYYYIDVSNGSSRIVTSPVWYTRNDNFVVPVTLSSFLVQKIDKSAKISWSTEQEINSSFFDVERSAEGRSWTQIGRVTAAGSSSQHTDYSLYDNFPAKGINYYRLKQVDLDGRSVNSSVKSLVFNINYDVSITPNPASSFITISVSKQNAEMTQIIISDANGRVVEKINSIERIKTINTTGYTKGIYFIKTITAQNVNTQKIILQ
ncbi:MAG: T9SS type A sorting domain-containing protein, partial [Ferruginibacter sp.]